MMQTNTYYFKFKMALYSSVSVIKFYNSSTKLQNHYCKAEAQLSFTCFNQYMYIFT